MTSPAEFVAAWRREKDWLLREFTDPAGTSAVAARLRDMSLSSSQQKVFLQLMDTALTDTFYTLLLGLAGEASIGGVQQIYQICAQDGTPLSTGEIEGEAFHAFHTSNV